MGIVLDLDSTQQHFLYSTFKTISSQRGIWKEKKKEKNAKMQSKNYSINEILKKHGAHATFNLTIRKEEV